MNLHIIKILGIFIVTICCIIAAYTDVKRQIIPNKLTFSTFIIGISLVSLYYFQEGIFNIHYYVSILLVFILSYILWYLGVWAGGDVKLFTAISTLLIPEFLDMIPHYTVFNMILPVGISSFPIPTVLLIFNSVLSIVPVIVMIISYTILKDKCYLINDLKETLNFKEVFLSLNSLIISYIIISQIDVHYTIIKMVFLIIFSYFIYRIQKNDIILIALTVIIIIQQFLASNILIYLEELVILSFTIMVKNIYATGLIKEALTEKTLKTSLEEGMILAYPLYCQDNKYYFDKSTLYTKVKKHISGKDMGKRVCNTQASGLTIEDIFKIIEIGEIDKVPIKKGLSFAPFILAGLAITFLVGNTFTIITTLLGRI